MSEFSMVLMAFFQHAAWPVSVAVSVFFAARAAASLVGIVQLDTVSADDRMRKLEAEAQAEVNMLRQVRERAENHALEWESAKQDIKNDLDAMRVASMNT